MNMKLCTVHISMEFSLSTNLRFLLNGSLLSFRKRSTTAACCYESCRCQAVVSSACMLTNMDWVYSTYLFVLGCISNPPNFPSVRMPGLDMVLPAVFFWDLSETAYPSHFCFKESAYEQPMLSAECNSYARMYACSYGGSNLGQGRDKTVAYLEEHQDVCRWDSQLGTSEHTCCFWFIPWWFGNVIMRGTRKLHYCMSNISIRSNVVEPQIPWWFV